MTPAQTRIVQRTWLKVVPIKDRTALLFYDRLFEIDPSLIPLFRADIRQQGDKLMQIMDAAVNAINQQALVVPMVQALGRRHAGYGVKGYHYGAVGAALLWALGEALGSEFTPEVKDAWAAVYGFLARTMREAAASAVG